MGFFLTTVRLFFTSPSKNGLMGLLKVQRDSQPFSLPFTILPVIPGSDAAEQDALTCSERKFRNNKDKTCLCEFLGGIPHLLIS